MRRFLLNLLLLLPFQIILIVAKLENELETWFSVFLPLLIIVSIYTLAKIGTYLIKKIEDYENYKKSN